MLQNDEKRILIVGSEYPQKKNEHPLAKKFIQLIYPFSSVFSFDYLNLCEEIPSYLAKNVTPHLIVIDELCITSNIKSIIDGVHELDRSCVCLLLKSNDPSSQDVIEMMDKGFSGILRKDFQLNTLSDALSEIIEKRLKLQMGRVPRAPTQHKISLKIASIEQALVAEVLNIGIGGMFVRMAPHQIQVGDHVDFDLEITKQLSAHDNFHAEENTTIKFVRQLNDESHVEGPIKKIIGEGHVVWTRTHNSPFGPEGIGIQYKNLSNEMAEIVEKIVASHRIKAFIPKS